MLYVFGELIECQSPTCIWCTAAQWQRGLLGQLLGSVFPQHQLGRYRRAMWGGHLKPQHQWYVYFMLQPQAGCPCWGQGRCTRAERGECLPPRHIDRTQTSTYMLKHLENGLMMFTTEMNCTITVSLIYIKNYSRQMHLHKIYLFILIYRNLHNLSPPTAICRQPLGK